MDLQRFLNTYHNIPNNLTANEKKKQYNILLQEIPDDHDALITSIVPNNYLAHIFKMNLLLKLHRISDLLEILLSQEEAIIFKLLKNKWFCEKLTHMLEEDSSGFVDEILPSTSYVTRLRILRILAKHGKKLDKVYDDLNDRYGLHIATHMLVGCSKEKIQETLENIKVKISVWNQKELFCKYPELFLLYCEKCDCNIDDSVIRFIIRMDFNYFMKLTPHILLHYSDKNLGKRSTRKLLKSYQNLVIANANKLASYLHLRTVVKTLNTDNAIDFTLQCVPNTFDQFICFSNVTFNNLRKALGSRRYYAHLLEISIQKYEIDLYAYPSLIDETMIEYMDEDDRRLWLDTKREENDGDYLIPFMAINDALRLLKFKINVTSCIRDRDELIQLMVKTCKINNDLNALAGVCDYVCDRHRYDSVEILSNFLCTIKDCFELEKLEEKHWMFIKTLIKLCTRQGHDYFKRDFCMGELKYLYFKQQLSDDTIFQYLHSMKFNFPKTEIKDLDKIILLKRIELMPRLVEEKDVAYKDLALISEIIDWNKSNLEQISIFDYPRLVDSLRKCLRDAAELDTYVFELRTLRKILERFICTRENENIRCDLIPIYFSLGFPYYNLNIDFWLLKNEPERISENLHKFIEHLLSGCNPDLRILNYIRKYTSFWLKDNIVKCALELISQKRSTNVVFTTLAVLEPPKNFYEHIAPLYPASTKLADMDNHSGGVATAIAKSFKYVSDIEVFPILIAYCKGDFLRYSLESLYYRFLHTPEKDLKVIVNQLSSMSVSVRKHSLFLTSIVGSVSDMQELLQAFHANESNVSVQKHLFSAGLKYFLKNPSDEFWTFVQNTMLNLDDNDCESIEMIISNFKTIPEKHQLQYVVFVWVLLKKSRDVMQYQRRLLALIPIKLYSDLPLSFILEVIDDHFVRHESKLMKDNHIINDFVSHCLTKSSFKQNTFNSVMTFIRRLDNLMEDASSFAVEVQTRNLIFSFVDSFLRVVAESVDNLPIVAKFETEWNNKFHMNWCIRIHIKIVLTDFYLSSSRDMVQFKPHIIEYLNTLIASHGIAVIDCYASEMIEFLGNNFEGYYQYTKPYLNLLLSLLDIHKNNNCYMFVLKMLPTSIPSNGGESVVFLRIIHLLLGVKDSTIEMLINSFIMNVEVAF